MTEKKNDVSGKILPIRQHGPHTEPIAELFTFRDFYDAVKMQTAYLIKRSVDTFELSERLRAQYGNTPYLSTLVKGTIPSAKDVTEGGAELRYVTIEGVTFATTVDSILAVKYLVYDKKECTLETLRNALMFFERR